MHYFLLIFILLASGCSKNEKVEKTEQEKPPQEKAVQKQVVKKENPPNKNYLLQKVYNFYYLVFMKANHLKMFHSAAKSGIAYADNQNESYEIDLSAKRHLNNFKKGKKEIDVLFKEFDKPGPAQKETYKFIANLYSTLNEYEKVFVVENMQNVEKYKEIQNEKLLPFEKAKKELHEHYKKLLKLKTESKKEPLLPAL